MPNTKSNKQVKMAETVTTKKRARNRKNKSATKGQSGGQVGIRQGNTDASLYSVQGGASKPFMNFSMKAGSTPGGVRVSGRSLVGALTPTTGTAFEIVSGIFLRPGLIPRLASISQAYEMYIFHRARLIYQSAQPLTVPGVVMLAADYDPKDNPPTSAVEMMRNISSAMSNVYADCAIEVTKELSRLPRYFVNQDTAPDAGQLDQASLIVATQAVPAATGIGFFFIEYDVEFFTPQ